MQGSTEKKRGAVLSAVVHCLLQAVSAGFLIWGAVAPGIPKGLSVALFLMAGVCVILIFVTCVVLKKRLNEIEGGEEDAASKY
jgi:hypothetical protein